MAMPNPITTSVPTAGTTLLSITKVSSGVYQLISGTDFVAVVKLFPADRMKKNGQLRIYFAKDYSLYDLAPASPSGRMSGNFSCSFTPGTDVTESDVISFVQQFGSILASAAIATGMVQGSLE